MSPHDPSPSGPSLGHLATLSAIPVGAANTGREHASHEAFPRLAVRDLIGGELRETHRRENWQDWAIAFGLVFLALALPTARLLGEGPALVAATDRGEWFSLHVLLQPLSRLIGLIPLVGAERAWFLISAVCWGSSFLVLSRIAMGLGVPRLAALCSTLLVVVSPLALLAGTLPGPAAAALLGSSILFRSLLAPRGSNSDEMRRVHPALVWMMVCLLSPALILFFPALVWRLWAAGTEPDEKRRDRRRDAGAVIGALLAVLFMLAVSATLGQRTFDLASIAGSIAAALLGKGNAAAPDSFTWLLVLIPAIGVGVLGIVELLRRPTDPNESSPPAWIVGFLAVPIVVRLLSGAPSLSTGAWILSPVLVLGLASYLGRMFEVWHWTAIVGLTAAQLLLSSGFRFTLTAGDPDRVWTQRATTMLNPGDLVLTRDQQHDYLLHHRFHLNTVNLRFPNELAEADRADWWAHSRDIVRAQARAGGRVLVDWKVGDPAGGGRGYAFQTELHELLLLAPILHLDPGGEKRSALDDKEVRKGLDDL